MIADTSPKATCRPGMPCCLWADLKTNTHLIQEVQLAVLQGDGARHCTKASLVRQECGSHSVQIVPERNYNVDTYHTQECECWQVVAAEESRGCSIRGSSGHSGHPAVWQRQWTATGKHLACWNVACATMPQQISGHLCRTQQPGRGKQAAGADLPAQCMFANCKTQEFAWSPLISAVSSPDLMSATAS